MSREPGGRGQAAGKQASCKQQDSTGLPMVAQWLRTCQPVQEIWIRFLGWEDALEKETATHSSILAWEISWAEEPGGLQSMGSQRSGHDLATKRTVNFTTAGGILEINPLAPGLPSVQAQQPSVARGGPPHDPCWRCERLRWEAIR